MRIYLISDQVRISNRVREILLREGQDLPPEQIVPIDIALDVVSRGRPDLIALVLSPVPDRALDLLARLRRLTRAPVLAIGNAGDPQLILRSLHAGVTDFADETNLGADLVAAFYRMGAAGLGEPGTVLAVLGPSGGSGASTVAANVAVALAARKHRPLLIDLKMPMGDLATLLDLKPTHTLADLCVNASRLDRSMIEGTVLTHSSGVRLLASPQAFPDCSQVTSEGVREIIALSRRMFSHVVVDLDHSFTPEQVEVLLTADTILLVLHLHFSCLRNARRTLDYLDQLGIPAERVRVVVNGYGGAKEVPAAQAEQALGLKISHYIPDEPATVNRANNNGVPVVLESPRARVSRSLTDLAASLNGRHG